MSPDDALAALVAATVVIVLVIGVIATILHKAIFSKLHKMITLAENMGYPRHEAVKITAKTRPIRWWLYEKIGPLIYDETGIE